MSQAQMAELFGKNVRTIKKHIGNVFEEGKLEREATILEFRIVRLEVRCLLWRRIEHDYLDAMVPAGRETLT